MNFNVCVCYVQTVIRRYIYDDLYIECCEHALCDKHTQLNFVMIIRICKLLYAQYNYNNVA